MTRSYSSRSRDGSALISTMLVIVVLTIIVVAFMQSMSVERKTAHSYLNRYRASLAADAGEADAIGTLLKGGTNTDTYSITQTNFSSAIPPSRTAKPPYYFITQPVQSGTTSTVTYVPLVSGGQTVTGKPMGTMPTAAEIFNPADPEVSTTEPKLPSYLAAYYGADNTATPRKDVSPETRWVYLKDADGKNISRYCYWVEDLQGRLDLQLVGNQRGAGNSQERGVFLGDQKPENHDKHVAEIGLFTLFDKDKNKADDDGSTNAKEILNNRAKLLTGATVNQIVPNINGVPGINGATEKNGGNDGTADNLADDPQQFFYYGLGYELNEPEIIPPGFGFANAGLPIPSPKLALNDIIPNATAATVQKIAQAINQNMPSFGSSRAGGMSATDYVNNLAASIIDYADADSQTTTDGSTYRGMDSFPLVNQWVIQSGYSKTKTNVTFTTHYYLEMWNMSDKTISGTVRLQFTNTYRTSVGGANIDLTTGYTGELTDVAISLAPNAKKAIDMGVRTYKADTPTIPATSASMSSTYGSANYQVFWKDDSNASVGFKMIDRSGTNPGGLDLVDKSFSGTSNWNASIPSLTHRISASSFLDGSVGDPRASYYITAAHDQSAWDTRGCVGGRTIRNGLTGNTYGETKPSFWADPGFDGPGGSDWGTFTGGASPTSISNPKNPRPDWAMVHYGNYADSKYRSITELGNIFDPAQWQQYSGQPSHTSLDAQVKTGLADIDTKKGSAKDGKFGGGFTLRIGRPEFTEFDNTAPNKTGDKYAAKARAADLLGILSTESSHSTRGLININTAPRDVLRALGAGIAITNPKWDDDTRPGETSPFISYSVPATIHGPKGIIPPDPEKTTAEADQFADAIIANRPFYSAHEMASRLKVQATSTGSSAKTSQLFWGNPNVWISNPPTAWRDAAAEEYLRQIYDLVTVRSRNFRIHVTGQVLDPKGNVTSTSRKIADVFLQPIRDPSAPHAITSQIVKHLYDISY